MDSQAGGFSDEAIFAVAFHAERARVGGRDPPTLERLPSTAAEQTVRADDKQWLAA